MNKTQSKTHLAKYLYGCVFSPVTSTLKTAIGKGNFVTWPGIDSLNFTKLVGPTIPAAKGHLDQERKGLQSTKTQIKLEDAHEDAFPEQSLRKTRTMGISVTELKHVAYSDLTGKTPTYLREVMHTNSLSSLRRKCNISRSSKDKASKRNCHSMGVQTFATH